VKTMFHELAHIALEHGGCAFGARSVAELEAESVAWICCDAVARFRRVLVRLRGDMGGGGDAAIAGIRDSAQRIQRGEQKPARTAHRREVVRRGGGVQAV